MNIFNKQIKPEVAVDLIELVNSCVGFEKKGSAEYSVKGANGRWTKVTFNWVLLDDILAKTKETNNFAVMQPLGQDEKGNDAVKTILIHKSGEVLESGWFKLSFADGVIIKDKDGNEKLWGADSSQDKGSKITFMRRYSLGSFLGISTETDNDGVKTDEVVDEIITDEIEKANKKAQKEITTWFENAVTLLGTRELVYKNIGLTREEFLIDYQAKPIELLEQLKRVKIDA